MIIDFHTHVLAPEESHTFTDTRFLDKVLTAGSRSRRPPHSIEAVLAAQEAGGIDITMVSNPLHRLSDLDRTQQLEVVRKHNRYVASLQEKYDSIFGFAASASVLCSFHHAAARSSDQSSTLSHASSACARDSALA